MKLKTAAITWDLYIDPMLPNYLSIDIYRFKELEAGVLVALRDIPKLVAALTKAARGAK